MRRNQKVLASKTQLFISDFRIMHSQQERSMFRRYAHPRFNGAHSRFNGAHPRFNDIINWAF